jgi:hypothetical protein
VGCGFLFSFVPFNFVPFSFVSFIVVLQICFTFSMASRTDGRAAHTSSFPFVQE